MTFQSFLRTVREKLQEALNSVLPVVFLVLLLCFTIVPISSSILLCFLLGAAMIVLGIMFFTLGAEISMTPMGERVGTAMIKRKSLPLMIFLGFVLGFIITVSEPDLQVLAQQVPSIPNATLILSVAAGVGLFLVVCVAANAAWYPTFAPFGVFLPDCLSSFQLCFSGISRCRF